MLNRQEREWLTALETACETGYIEITCETGYIDNKSVLVNIPPRIAGILGGIRERQFRVPTVVELPGKDAIREMMRTMKQMIDGDEKWKPDGGDDTPAGDSGLKP